MPPVDNPTKSYWQIPHSLASYRSPFPEEVDVVIIGSGITGVSVARTLYEHDPSLKVAILEARQLCSGATGRNGGHIKPGTVRDFTNEASYHHWPHRTEKYGIAEAIKMSRFENAHPAALARLSEKYNIDCDLQLLATVDAYYDQTGFERATAATKAIEEYVPEIVHKIWMGKEAQERFRVSEKSVGAITYAAGQIWPYKFVTNIAEFLLDRGLNLQTNTPVTAVHNGMVETPRGNIRGSKIVHATNGYLQHLLPEFSIIQPTRGHMTAQITPKSLEKLGRTYSFIYEDGKFDYFIQHHDKLIFGGGYHEDPQPTTYDDSDEPEMAQQYLLNQLPKVLRWEGEADPEKRLWMGWSGIMGFSEDGLPWVGNVSEGQFICAGYTGEGTI